MDTATFQLITGIIISCLEDIDKELGSTAQRYVTAIIGEKEGVVKKEDVHKILDSIPEVKTLDPDAISFLAEMFKLSAVYLVT